MVIIDRDDQFPDVAAVLIARALWRYRSELAPVYLVALLALGGAILHLTYAEWWPWLVGVATLAAWALATFGERVGLALRIKRIYAATVAMVGGGWLAAATALGVTFRPLPLMLAGVGFLLALPWWVHRRRRAKVRVDRQIAAWPEIAQAVGLAGSRAQSAVVDVWGWRARFALARGQTIQLRADRHKGETKTTLSRRGLGIADMAVDALRNLKTRQAAEKLKAGEEYQDNSLVFCHVDGRPYTAQHVRHRFRMILKAANLNPTEWRPRELRHTFVSIMSDHDVPIEDLHPRRALQHEDHRNCLPSPAQARDPRGR